MKKIFIFLAVILAIISATSFLGCDSPSNRDYNADIVEVPPENITMEHFTIKDGKTYYTSHGLSLWISVNGAFLEMDYFYLDGNKRVYDDTYFYKGDYFYMVTGNALDLYASLSNSVNNEYAEVERQSGEDVQINVKKTGKYKLIFDVDTLKFDMEFIEDIVEPVYYTIKNCSIYSVSTSWVEMSVNPNDQDEFYISNFHIDSGKAINFFNNIHTSVYVPTLDNSALRYGEVRKDNVDIFIGGNYNVYINKKTYVVRLELINKETADYTLVYYDGNDFITIQPENQSQPYLFTYQLEVGDTYTKTPNFYTSHYRQYRLSVVSSPLLLVSGENYYFKDIGTYKININLKEFTLSVELLA